MKPEVPTALSNLELGVSRPTKKKCEDDSNQLPSISARAQPRKRPITPSSSSPNLSLGEEETISGAGARSAKRPRRGTFSNGPSGRKMEVVLPLRQAPVLASGASAAKPTTRGQTHAAATAQEEAISDTPAQSTRAKSRAQPASKAQEPNQSEPTRPSRGTRTRTRAAEEPAQAGPPSRRGRPPRVQASQSSEELEQSKRQPSRAKGKGKAVYETAARRQRRQSRDSEYAESEDGIAEDEDHEVNPEPVLESPSRGTRSRTAVAEGRIQEDPELTESPSRGTRSHADTKLELNARSIKAKGRSRSTAEDRSEEVAVPPSGNNSTVKNLPRPPWATFSHVSVMPLSEVQKQNRARRLEKQREGQREGGSDKDAEGEEDDEMPVSLNEISTCYAQVSTSVSADHGLLAVQHRGPGGYSPTRPQGSIATIPPLSPSPKPSTPEHQDGENRENETPRPSESGYKPLTPDPSHRTGPAAGEDIFRDVDLSVPPEDDAVMDDFITYILDGVTPEAGPSGVPRSPDESLDPLDVIGGSGAETTPSIDASTPGDSETRFEAAEEPFPEGPIVGQGMGLVVPVPAEGETVVVKTTVTTVEEVEEVIERATPSVGDQSTPEPDVPVAGPSGIVPEAVWDEPEYTLDPLETPEEVVDTPIATPPPVAHPVAAAGMPMTPPLSHTRTSAPRFNPFVTPVKQTPRGIPSTPAVHGPPSVPPSPAPVHVIPSTSAIPPLPIVGPSPLPLRVAQLTAAGLDPADLPTTPDQEYGPPDVPPTPAPVHVADVEMANGI